MKKCKGCGDDFEPEKDYWVFCGDCMQNAFVCSICKKVAANKDGEISCCGITEDADKIRSKHRINSRNFAQTLTNAGFFKDSSDY